MVQIFYSIFNNDTLLFANNAQYNKKEEAEQDIKKIYNRVSKQKNKKIIEYTNNVLKFIDIPKSAEENEETHIFIIK